MEKLKPCPFCGGRGEVRNVHYSTKNWMGQDKKWIEKEATCISCNARSQHFKDEKNAIEAWNRRAKEAKKYRAVVEAAERIRDVRYGRALQSTDIDLLVIELNKLAALEGK